MDAPVVQSKFLPGTLIQFAWDSTSLGALKTCPRLYQYTMIEGWTPKGENIHLRFGIEYHQALQDYDVSRAAGINHDDAVHDTLRALLHRIYDWDPSPNDEKRSEKSKSKANLIRTVLWYLDKYEDDPAKTYIMDNGKPAVELSFKFELDWGPTVLDSISSPQPYLLCGHLDRVVSFSGHLYVMDRKTTTTTPGSYFFDQFEPNNQMSLYTLASQVLFESPIRGVIIDVAQIAVDFSRYVRGFTYRTPDQLEEWTKDLEFWFNLAESYAEANYWPMNEASCYNFGGCKFRGICSKSPQVREAFLRSEFEKGEPWNPLKSR